MGGPNMIKVIDYNKKYAKQVDIFDQNYWGVNEGETPSDEIEAHNIVKLALDKDKVVGIIYFKLIGNLIGFHQILGENSYQNQGIGQFYYNQRYLKFVNMILKIL